MYIYLHFTYLLKINDTNMYRNKTFGDILILFIPVILEISFYVYKKKFIQTISLQVISVDKVYFPSGKIFIYLVEELAMSTRCMQFHLLIHT